MSRAKFKEGDKVVITSYGTVESVFEGEGECQYSVTLKGGYSTLYGVKERDIRKK